MVDDPSESVKLSQGLVKTITGCPVYTCRTLNKTPKTFKMTLRLVVLCNSLPQFKMEDAGILRRILVLEMKTSFVEREAWDALSDEQRASGRFYLKDDEFKARLVENLSGMLKYFLVGASEYTRNPRLAAPAAMIAAKQRASSILDTLGGWIRGNLKKLEKTAANRKKCVSYTSIKEIWAEQKLEFPNMRQHAFKHNFLEQLETAGYEVDRGTEGKSREKIVYCEMLRDPIFAEEGDDDEPATNTIVYPE